MNEPTPDDMLRNLEADLRHCKCLEPGPWLDGDLAVPWMRSVFALCSKEWKEWSPFEESLLGILEAREGWPAAIRRALAAEAEADRLRNLCHMLGQENRICREDVRGIIDRECQTLADELADVKAERDRLRAILDAPRVMLFADGREPTTNERHLANLLSWRQKEAGEARAELAGVRAELDHLHEAARAVLSVLRDRLDGTKDQGLVDELERALTQE